MKKQESKVPTRQSFRYHLGKPYLPSLFAHPSALPPNRPPAIASLRYVFMLRRLKTRACIHYILTEAPLDVYIVGGYLDEPLADDLSRALLSNLDASQQVFRVVLACMSGLNSRRPNNDDDYVNPEMNGSRTSKPWFPKRTSLAVDIASGRAFPVRFEGVGRGPGFEVRHSRILAGGGEEALAEVRKRNSI